MEPVNATARIPGWVTSAVPPSRPNTSPIVPSGAPAASAPRTIARWTAADSAGCDECALATTGQPAAIAAAVSPPATENANGKFDAPNTATGPSGTRYRRTSASGPIGDSWAGSITASR